MLFFFSLTTLVRLRSQSLLAYPAVESYIRLRHWLRAAVYGTRKAPSVRHQQQCRSNIPHCRKNRYICSIQRCCFDTVAGMDGAQK